MSAFRLAMTNGSSVDDFTLPLWISAVTSLSTLIETHAGSNEEINVCNVHWRTPGFGNWSCRCCWRRVLLSLAGCVRSAHLPLTIQLHENYNTYVSNSNSVKRSLILFTTLGLKQFASSNKPSRCNMFDDPILTSSMSLPNHGLLSTVALTRCRYVDCLCLSILVSISYRVV